MGPLETFGNRVAVGWRFRGFGNDGELAGRKQYVE